MNHLGDITKISGFTAPPVNVIIGGSPCQDLSIAGKRAGLAGERSGLFMEQIRIIKEMRKADENRGRTNEHIRPRFMVWENVPGAFSSGKGADFGAVLQETIRVVCKEVPVVPIPKNGWPPAGCLTDVGGQWSIAWRVFDAQFWGVPQRRKRIALVADFGGLTAPEILFERQGVSGDSAKGRAPWEGTSRPSESGVNKASGAVAPTYCIQGNCIDRADTAGCNGRGWTEGVSYTLNTVDRPAVAVAAVNCRNYTENDEVNGTIQAKSGGGYNLNSNHVIRKGNLLRRLTPLECERLQGFPDGWTDIGEWTDTKGKVHKECTDSARYKALGNSIALPPWTYVLQRLSLCCGVKPTMASLFDGIGGFPLIWERINGKGSCLWASEIEEFPIAVTRRHFPEEDKA